MNENLLDNIPDKREDKNTTSLKFKSDIIEYFKDIDTSDFKCIEVGTNKGYTTRILSGLFAHVITMENNKSVMIEAMEFNKGRDNIDFLLGDVYKSDWGIEGEYDVTFIDCNHAYDYVKRDIENCLKYNVKYLIFDDYGLPESSPSVKVAVDEFVKQNANAQITYIGEPKGSEPRIGRKLIDWEGVIVKIKDKL